MKNDVIQVVAGPTASGKSALALQMARECGGEIVSADSMQLYRGLEIGTAQPSAAERAEIPHHLVGCFELDRRVDVFAYCEFADRAIADIRARGRKVVVAGGTGLYLLALLRGLDDLPSDRVLRDELDRRYDTPQGEIELHRRMALDDPAALDKWGRCRRRLIRALEVKLLTGKSILDLQTRREDTPPRYNYRLHLLDPSPDELRRRIRLRIDQMLAAGWLEETRRAVASGLLNSPTAHQAIGYRLLNEHLTGKITLDEATQKIYHATCAYARRQRTWFRHQLPEC